MEIHLHKLLNMASGDNIYNNSRNSLYVTQAGYWCPSQYGSSFPNQSTWEGTLRPATWTEQEMLYYSPHSLACELFRNEQELIDNQHHQEEWGTQEGTQCRDKWHNLLNAYKEAKDSSTKTGNGTNTMKSFKHFEQMERDHLTCERRGRKLKQKKRIQFTFV